MVDTAIAPIKDVNGKVESFLAIRLDVTDRKINDEIITKQQAQIVSQSKLSALGEMAGGIAHEINNPLAAITLTMRSIRKMVDRDQTKSDEFTEALHIIDDTVLRITKIISGLKNVTREPENEDFELCPVKDILEDVLSLCFEKFRSQGIEFEVEAGEEILAKEIQIMRVLLSQVFLNLLSNSYDNVIGQNDEKWIKIKIEETKSHMIFRVIDSGKGVPEDLREKIFQPFFTTKEIGKGTGLGLSLSHSIVKKHEGDIYIDSENPNTCFVFSIPINSHLA